MQCQSSKLHLNIKVVTSNYPLLWLSHALLLFLTKFDEKKTLLVTLKAIKNEHKNILKLLQMLEHLNNNANKKYVAISSSQFFEYKKT